MAEQKVTLKITPVLDEKGFKTLQDNFDKMSKMQVKPGAEGLNKSSSKEVSKYSKSAESALEKGNIKKFNTETGNMLRAMKDFVGTLITGDKDLTKALNRLTADIKSNEEKLIKQQKELASLKARRDKAQEGTAYEVRAAKKGGIAYQGQGRQTDASGQQTLVKSEGGLIQTLRKIVKDGNDWAQKLHDFAKGQGLKTSFDKSNSETAIRQVAAEYTELAKKELDEEIKSQETGVGKTSDTISSQYKEQNEMVDKIAQLNPELKELVDHFKELNSILKKESSTATGLAEQEGTEEGTAQGEATNQAIAEQENLSKSLDNTNKSFRKTLVGATLYGIAIRQLRKLLNDAVKTITELDRSLTTQAMVSGKTRRETYQLLKSYQALADQCGATSVEVAEVATAYFRQGKSVTDALKLTETAVKAAKVAGISTKESVDYLTTAVNGFQLAAEDAMKVSDKFAALASQAAVSYDELATALSKVASQANLAGLSMDYTLALLTKGIETTRESAESIGTALKTVLARMREISDYGETLSGDTDLNNVETQLGYVGIELRNQNGELRSTQEVLDELGNKWNTLNSNQQAAIAKALAGTRQQSRLIAMMQDYQRTTELVLISQRSLGATEAQMAEYMSGMEAATNRVTTAYQNLVESFTNSDTIISVVNDIANIINSIASFLSTESGMGFTIMFIAGIGVNILQNLIQQKVELAEQAELERKKSLIKERDAILAKNGIKSEEAKNKVIKATTEQLKLQALLGQKSILEAKQEAYIKKHGQASAKISAEINKLNLDITKQEGIAAAANAEAKEEMAKLQKEDLDRVNELQKEIESKTSSTQLLWNQISGSIQNIISIVIPFVGILKTILSLQKLMNSEETKNWIIEKKKNIEKEKGLKKKFLSAALSMAESAGAIPVVGWGIGLAILAALVGLAVAGIAKASQSSNKGEEKTREQIQNLTQDIYNLEKSSQAIDTIGTKFETLNNKIIKTQEEIQELDKLLNDLKDQGFSEGEIAQIRQLANEGRTDEALAIIAQGSQKKQNAANALRATKVSTASGLDETERRSILSEGILADMQKTAAKRGLTGDQQTLLGSFIQNGAAGLNYEALQARVTDKFASISLDWTEKEVKNKLSKLDSFKDFDFGHKNKDKIQDALKKGDLATLSALLDDEQLADVLDIVSKETGTEFGNIFGDTASEIIDAIEDSDAMEDLSRVMDTSSIKWDKYKDSFNNLKIALEGTVVDINETFPQLSQLLTTMTDETVELAGKARISVQQMTDIYNALSKQGVGASDAKSMVDAYLTYLTEDTDEAYENMMSAFGDKVENLQELITQLGNITTKTLEEMSQSVSNGQNARKKLQEAVSNFASTGNAAELYQSLSGLGLNSADALTAAMNQDWVTLNEEFAKIQAKNITELKEENDKMIRNLEAQKSLLDKDDEDAITAIDGQIAAAKANEKAIERMYDMSLEDQLNIQNERLNAYKEYLEKQAEVEKENLDKLKESYQNYFDEINQAIEDEDYFTERDKLLNNINALGAGTDAASVKALADLEQQLLDQQKEREETLRQRAQEALIENIDSQIGSIDDTLKDILESSQALLNAYNSDANNTGNILTQRVIGGADTGLDLLNNINDIAGITGTSASNVIQSLLRTNGINSNNIDTRTNAQGVNSMILNIGGKEVIISESDQSYLYEEIQRALTQIGVGG